MIRTTIRLSEELNTGKRVELLKEITAFSAQKDDFLQDFAHVKYLDMLCDNRIRDALVASGFKSPHGMKAWPWKMALKEALETTGRMWRAAFVPVRVYIHRKFVSPIERHYASWLLKDYVNVQHFMDGEVPGDQPGGVDLPLSRREYIVRAVRRNVRKNLGKRPQVNLNRSMVLHPSSYRTFVQGGTQYIAISKHDERGRIVVPLKGFQTIPAFAVLRVIEDGGSIDVHVSRQFDAKPEPEDGIETGLDFGKTELFASQTAKYYPEFGRDIDTYSDALDGKMRKRGKLHALEKSLRWTNPAKARRIRKFNPGKSKLSRANERFRDTVKTMANTTINQFIKTERPKMVDYENLGSYRPPVGQGRRRARTLSLWMRSFLSDRIPFKLQAGGSRSQAVNPAYSSQTDPDCGYVDPKNRNGDRFKCLNPEHSAKSPVLDADTEVGARNLKMRRDDPEIHLWTPKEQVREILVRRFEKRRLERLANGARADVDWTVPAGTPGRTRSSRRKRSVSEQTGG